MRGRAPSRIATGFFRAAILAYPRWLRRRYGAAMEDAFRVRFRERRNEGRRVAAAWAVRAVADALVGGCRERWKGAPAAHVAAGLKRHPQGGGDGMFAWWTDTKIAGRSLRRTPGFTAAAILMLALGIGANAAIFSAVRGTLLAPPPFPEPDRIVLLDLTEADAAAGGEPRAFPWSFPKFRLLAETEGLLAHPVAAFASRTLTLTGAGDAAVLPVEIVSPGYLEALGAVPVLGRRLTAGDDAPDAPLAAVLAHGLWQERFGGDPAILGRSLTLNGREVTVVGVAPAGFAGLTGGARLWVPVHTGGALIAPFLVTGAQAHWLRAVGRLREGATVEALDEQMRSVGRAVEEAFPSSDPTVARGADAEPLTAARVHPEARRSLLVLSAAAALLLLVACANLAGLLVARASGRIRETAIRIALGAGRWRVARRFLVESLLLAVAGGLAAVIVARFGTDWLVAAWPTRFLHGSWNVRFADLDQVRVEGTVLAFAGGVSLLAGLLFGAIPALAALRTRPGDGLREGAAGAVGGRRTRWDVRGLLVTAEIALALVLLVGAGLLLRSLQQLQAVERGYEPGDLVALRVSIPRTSRWAEDDAALAALFLARVQALPGVESAAVGCTPPVSGHCFITGVRTAGARTFAEGEQPPIGVHYVSDAYFETLGIPVRQGRTFTASDREGTAPVVVLSEAAARALFPGGDALGSRLAAGAEPIAEEGASGEIVGIVGDVLYDRPENGLMPEMYLSHRQGEGFGRVFLRTRGEPMAVVPAVRDVLRDIDPDLPLSSVQTFAEVEAGASSNTRVLGLLLAAFALLALVLACAGVWAVVAYTVARRTRELGLRMALGARSGRVVRLVLGQGMAPALVGIVLGAAGAWFATRLLSALLFGVAPTDPLSFVAGAGTLLIVSLLAAWLPARRATRVDPMEALRAD